MSDLVTTALILTLAAFYLIARGVDAKRREDRLLDRITAEVRAEVRAERACETCERAKRLNANVVAFDSKGVTR